MTATCARVGHLVMRIQTDYLENPNLALTLPEAQRRFRIDAATGDDVLAALVDAGVLTERDGAYRRRFPRPWAA